MKYKYLIPVLVGAMLVAMVSPAFALDVQLSTLSSEFRNNHDVIITPTSGNHYYPAVNNNLKWSNSLKNLDSIDSYVSCGLSSSTWYGHVSPDPLSQSIGQIVYGAPPTSQDASVTVTSSSHEWFHRAHSYSLNSNPFINSWSNGFYDELN